MVIGSGSVVVGAGVVLVSLLSTDNARAKGGGCCQRRLGWGSGVVDDARGSE